MVRLVETHVDEVRSQWEERFEGRYGFRRGSIDKAVGAYLDCGILGHGFARERGVGPQRPSATLRLP